MIASSYSNLRRVYSTQFFLEVLLEGTGFPGQGNATAGEALSPLTLSSGENVGELRLLSDARLARDSRTACTWQSFVNQQASMASAFKSAMAQLALVGQNPRHLVDCSEVIPAPLPAVKKPATFPASKTARDLQLSCNTERFPTLSADGESLFYFRTRCYDADRDDFSSRQGDFDSSLPSATRRSYW